MFAPTITRVAPTSAATCRYSSTRQCSTSQARRISARADPGQEPKPRDSVPGSNVQLQDEDGNTPLAAANDTLIPRVEELRGDMGRKGYLKEGTSDFGGFFAAVGAEIATGETVAQQFTSAPGLVLAFSALIAVASFVPLIRGTKWLDDGFGESVDANNNPERQKGLSGVRFGFNVTNELITGRAAMFGMALLLVYEAGAKQAMF